MSDLTKSVTDADGYTYVEATELLAELCLVAPCSPLLSFPDYPSMWKDVVIDGKHVVIQLWKGSCQHFMMLPGQPGGVGGEVGVYHRILGKSARSPIPERLQGSPRATWALRLPEGTAHAASGPHPQVTAARVALAGGRSPDPALAASGGADAQGTTTGHALDLWWPYPELNEQLEFELTNPKTGKTFFKVGPRKGTGKYWLSHLMEFASYDKYKKSHPTPDKASDYRMTARVGSLRIDF